MPITKKDCPSCKARGSVITPSTSGIHICNNCSRAWDTLSSYDISCVLLGLPDGRDDDKDVLIGLTGDAYIDDGGLQNDLNDLARKSQTHILELVRSQLPIIDWEKRGFIPINDLDSYLQRMIQDIQDRRL